MEETIKKVTEILDQYFKEEFGNRLSQFSFVTLRSMIIDELKKVEVKKDV